MQMNAKDDIWLTFQYSEKVPLPAAGQGQPFSDKKRWMCRKNYTGYASLGHIFLSCFKQFLNYTLKKFASQSLFQNATQ